MNSPISTNITTRATKFDRNISAVNTQIKIIRIELF